MKKLLHELKGHLMSGISYMLPLIIGSSLVIAIPKIIGLAMGLTSLDAFAEAGGFAHILYLIEQVGWTGIGLINTILAGFIAYSIADKPGIGAGFIGGAIAANTQAGFLGAVIAGFTAGYVAKWCKEKITLPQLFHQAMPLVIIPLLATMSVAIVMGVILSGPLSAINNGLVEWIKHMIEKDTNKVILALIMGGMIGVDLGGPVNKASWMAGNVLLAEGIFLPAIIVNVANCAIPLGYAFATLIKKSRFSQELLDAGRNNFVMGFIGITEGAIPFTLVSPLKLVCVNILGGAIGPAVGILLGMYDKMPPVGGIYGFVSIGNGWAYLIAIIAGALVIGFLAPLLVDFNKDQSVDIAEEDIEIVFE